MMNKPFVMVVRMLVGLFLLAACRENPSTLAVDKAAYMQRGDSLTRMSFDTLRHTLLRKISTDGMAGAVRFCNLEAANLTRSFQTETQEISRTSLRYRNPGNRPDSLSKLVLSVMQASMDKGEMPQAQVIEDAAGAVHYYKPIMVQAMCLHCHGPAPSLVTGDVMAVIDSLYPGDLARNYKEGDLRGAWHIRFVSGKDR